MLSWSHCLGSVVAQCIMEEESAYFMTARKPKKREEETRTLTSPSRAPPRPNFLDLAAPPKTSPTSQQHHRLVTKPSAYDSLEDIQELNYGRYKLQIYTFSETAAYGSP